MNKYTTIKTGIWAGLRAVRKRRAANTKGAFVNPRYYLDVPKRTDGGIVIDRYAFSADLRNP